MGKTITELPEEQQQKERERAKAGLQEVEEIFGEANMKIKRAFGFNFLQFRTIILKAKADLVKETARAALFFKWEGNSRPLTDWQKGFNKRTKQSFKAYNLYKKTLSRERATLLDSFTYSNFISLYFASGGEVAATMQILKGVELRGAGDKIEGGFTKLATITITPPKGSKKIAIFVIEVVTFIELQAAFTLFVRDKAEELISHFRNREDLEGGSLFFGRSLFIKPAPKLEEEQTERTAGGETIKLQPEHIFSSGEKEEETKQPEEPKQEQQEQAQAQEQKEELQIVPAEPAVIEVAEKIIPAEELAVAAEQLKTYKAFALPNIVAANYGRIGENFWGVINGKEEELSKLQRIELQSILKGITDKDRELIKNTPFLLERVLLFLSRAVQEIRDNLGAKDFKQHCQRIGGEAVEYTEATGVAGYYIPVTVDFVELEKFCFGYTGRAENRNLLYAAYCILKALRSPSLEVPAKEGKKERRLISLAVLQERAVTVATAAGRKDIINKRVAINVNLAPIFAEKRGGYLEVPEDFMQRIFKHWQKNNGFPSQRVFLFIMFLSKERGLAKIKQKPPYRVQFTLAKLLGLLQLTKQYNAGRGKHRRRVLEQVKELLELFQRAGVFTYAVISEPEQPKSFRAVNITIMEEFWGYKRRTPLQKLTPLPIKPAEDIKTIEYKETAEEEIVPLPF